MIVLVLAACPAGLRGQLTRWLLEISPGVFVGRVSTRVRELLWSRVKELSREGRAIMVFQARNEQRLDFLVHRSDWVPVDREGVRLIMRPSDEWKEKRRQGRAPRAPGEPGIPSEVTGAAAEELPVRGWSNASRRRRAARNRRQRAADDE